MKDLLQLLTAKDTKEALIAFKKLEADCLASPIYVDQLKNCLPVLTAENACSRGRGFKFFMVNARWDEKGLIDTHLETILAVLDDPKAPIVRQCLPYLLYLAEAKPKLIPNIRKKITHLTLSQYKESMQSLIKRDIETVLKKL